VLASVQEQLSDRCIAIQLPIGSEHELKGVVDSLHNCAYMDPSGAREGIPSPIPAEMADTVEEYRTKLLDAVVETDEALMERYLGGEDIPAEDIAAALRTRSRADEIYPVACGVATKNLGTHALLDLIVEGVPSPAKKGSPIENRREDRRVHLQDSGRPVRRAHLDLPRVRGEVKGRHDARQPPRPFEGAPRLADDARGEGARERPTASAPATSARSRRLKDVQTGDVLVDDAEHDLAAAEARLSPSR